MTIDPEQHGFESPADEENKEEENPLEEQTDEDTEEDQDPAEADDTDGEDGDSAPEMVEIDGQEYQKGTPEYIEALESVHGRYKGSVQKMHDQARELAQYRQKTQQPSKTGDQEKDEDLPSYMRDDWNPQNISDVKKALIEATQYGMKQVEKQQEQQEQAIAEAKQAIDEWARTKEQDDKDFDRKAFFQYTDDRNIRINSVEDLDTAYGIYKDRLEAIRNAESQTRENITKRRGDSTTSPGTNKGGGGRTSDYTRDIRGSTSVLDAARRFMGK